MPGPKWGAGSRNGQAALIKAGAPRGCHCGAPTAFGWGRLGAARIRVQWHAGASQARVLQGALQFACTSTSHCRCCVVVVLGGAANSVGARAPGSPDKQTAPRATRSCARTQLAGACRGGQGVEQ